MDNELIKALCSAAAELVPEHDVLAAYAYGSRVVRSARAGSDLDVGYYLRGYREGARLPISEELHLADALSRRLGIEVDLRDVSGAPLEVRGRVLEEGVRVYSGDEQERVYLEADLLSRYHDYKPELEALQKIRLRRIAERGLR